MSQSATFRDPSGSCWLAGGRVFRVLLQEAAAGCEHFLQSPCARKFLEKRQLVHSRTLAAAESAALEKPQGLESSPGVILEHERIPFISFPYEWPPEMLWEAGQLTLELARAALADGYGLKDATPYNILFRGPEPVFIDLPSFERRDPGDPVWQPYGQFVRTFLLPLLGNQRWGQRLVDVFLAHRDGLEPQDLYALCGPFQRLRPQVLSLVSLPTWLNSKARAQGQNLYRSRKVADPEKARFILENLLKQLERWLQSLKPRRNKHSTWSDYMTTHSYQEPAFAAKEEFVSSFLHEFKFQRLLDVGANTGHFSVLAARTGAAVVAIDIDPACIGALWSRAHEEKLDILPLVIDLARPSPALGWHNAECPSFLERAAGQFDCMLMLAVVHHLLVTERIPLDEILRLAAELSTSGLIVEFVGPEDDMFRQLTRGREHLHASLTPAIFEQACLKFFEVVRSVALPGTHRRLYALRRR